MSWLKRLIPSKIRANDGEKKSSVPEGLWVKCPSCEEFLFRSELLRNLEVCPKCNYHMQLTARSRLNILFDEGQKEELAVKYEPIDILKFKDSKKYKDRLIAAQKKTKEKDALVVMRGKIKGLEVVACAFEFSFIGGSMGAVVGAKFVAAVDACLKYKLPLICFAASGGARMQESLISLMQMCKTSAALSRLKSAGLPFISVMVHPCTGGVSASLAMLGDLNLAEPKALIGFAGPKVIEQTVRQTLPEGFQRSEFLQEKGFVDKIVDRRDMRDTLHRLLSSLMYGYKH